jgi:hypothetical protein
LVAVPKCFYYPGCTQFMVRVCTDLYVLATKYVPGMYFPIRYFSLVTEKEKPRYFVGYFTLQYKLGDRKAPIFCRLLGRYVLAD